MESLKKNFLIPTGGIKSSPFKCLDGVERTVHVKCKTQDEIVGFAGSLMRLPDDEKGDLKRQRVRAEFIANGLCDETGEPLMTADEAYLIPAMTKVEICELIIKLSNDIGDAGNG